MGNDTFVLEVLVPKGRLLEKEVYAASLPTELGEIGVLPMHADYTALLGTGVVEFDSGEEKQKFVVSGGFVSFGENRLKIAADAAYRKEDIDPKNYGLERKKLELELKDLDTSSLEWKRLKQKLDTIEAIDLLL